MPVVSVRDARKAFGGADVLRGITLEVERGEVDLFGDKKE